MIICIIYHACLLLTNDKTSFLNLQKSGGGHTEDAPTNEGQQRLMERRRCVLSVQETGDCLTTGANGSSEDVRRLL